VDRHFHFEQPLDQIAADRGDDAERQLDDRPAGRGNGDAEAEQPACEQQRRDDALLNVALKFEEQARVAPARRAQLQFAGEEQPAEELADADVDPFLWFADPQRKL
jgi:hypothetical protein